MTTQYIVKIQKESEKNKASNTLTRKPLLKRVGTIKLPQYPAPPVIKTELKLLLK